VISLLASTTTLGTIALEGNPEKENVATIDFHPKNKLIIVNIIFFYNKLLFYIGWVTIIYSFKL